MFADLNRDADALSCYDQAISLNPNLAEAYFNKSFVKLSLGQYQEGWELYEWRWQARLARLPKRNFSQPLWLGDAELRGKTILIYAEQGLGDCIQFFRYLPLLQAGDYRVLFEAPGELIRLLRDQTEGIEFIAKGDDLPHFDFHCPLMSLPLAFGTTLATIPAAIPYLRADRDKIAVVARAARRRDQKVEAENRACLVGQAEPAGTRAAFLWRALRRSFLKKQSGTFCKRIFATATAKLSANSR